MRCRRARLRCGLRSRPRDSASSTSRFVPPAPAPRRSPSVPARPDRAHRGNILPSHRACEPGSSLCRSASACGWQRSVHRLPRPPRHAPRRQPPQQEKRRRQVAAECVGSCQGFIAGWLPGFRFGSRRSIIFPDRLPPVGPAKFDHIFVRLARLADGVRPAPARDKSRARTAGRRPAPACR